jgi:nucleotide-binding universal stress UspA family protein
MTDIHDKTFTIRDLSYSRALLLKMRFEMEGIPCFLTNIHHPDAGVDINLPAEFSEKAFVIAEELRQASGSEKEIMVKNLRSVRRILVPIDFSTLSIKAAHYALDLARTLKADIRLLNVWFNAANEGFVFNEMFAFQVNLEAIMKEQEAEAEAKILSVVDELKVRIRDEKIRGVDVDYDLVRGASVEAILEIVDDYKPGVVVMGTHGKTRESFGLLGSTTAKVIEKCKVPVLTVPYNYDTSGFFAPRSIAYITNFDETDFQALHRLITFVKPFNVKIYCIHIQPNESSILDKVKMKQTREYFNETYAEFDIECGLIETVDILEGVETFILEKQIDLIALISRKRNLLTQLLRPSLTKKLLFQSEIPILVFRETENASWIKRKSM